MTTPFTGKNILMFTSYDDAAPIKLHLPRVIKAMGGNCIKVGPPRKWLETQGVIRIMERAHFAFIINGLEPGCEWFKMVCITHNLGWLVAENGLLPQKGFWHIDSNGIGPLSSLSWSLSWVTQAMIDSYLQYRANYMRANNLRWERTTDDVVVPGQIWWDTSIYHSSFGRHGHLAMRKLMAEAEMHSHSPVLYVRHPKDKTVQPLADGATQYAGPLSTIQLAKNCGRAIGANSTVLLECEMIGVPTTALAECPLNTHTSPEARLRLMAACCARQIPLNVMNITPWLELMGVEVK